MKPALLVIASLVLAGIPRSGGLPAQDASTAPAETKPLEKEASLAQIRIRGSIEESTPPENPFGPSPLNTRGVIELIRKAKKDPVVTGMLLKVESPAIGLSKAREIIAALEDFKSAGKKIYAYIEDADPMNLLLYSPSSRITMPESAFCILPGVSAEVLYMKEILARLGIRFIVTPVGEYKTAFENFARDSMSPAMREVLESLVDSQYRALQEVIAKGRRIAPEKVAEAIDRTFLSPAELLELGLIDEVADREHFLADVKADLDVTKVRVLANYGQKSLQIDSNNPFAVFSMLMQVLAPPPKKSSSRVKIAIVHATGPIMPGKSQASPFGGGATCGSETLVDALKKATDDETVKAIVLRIDSPGGSGTASDAIWRAVLAAKAKKPVVASMSDVAGSGGYYIAMGASKILAQPETITGSIGVISAFVNAKGTLDKLGIRVERVSRGKNAGGLSPFAEPESVPVEALRKLIESFYWQFVDKAAQGRGKSREEIHKVAQGRVWTGKQALERGLIDELGGLDRSLEVARELAGLASGDDLEYLELPPPANFFEALSEGFGAARMEAALGAAGLEGQAASLLPEVRHVLGRIRLILEAGEGPLLLLPVEVRIR